jgi:hypothetical protein
VSEAHLVSVTLLPTEKEGDAESRRWKIHKATINVTELDPAASKAIHARLHLIDSGSDTQLQHRTARQRFPQGGVKIGRLELVLVGAAW